MTVRILSWTEDTSFSLSTEGLEGKSKQAWKADLGGLYTRTQVLICFAADARVPKTYQYAAYNSRLICTAVEIDQDSEVPNVWHVVAQYQTPQNVQQKEIDPSKRAALISTGTYKEQEYPSIDFDGKPVCTTAGEPLNYGYQRPYPMYTVDKNLSSYPTALASARNFTNTDTVSLFGVTFDPYQLLIPDISISHLQYEGPYSYFALNFSIYAKTTEFGWRTRVRNAGYHERTLISWLDKRGRLLPKNKWVYGLKAILLGVTAQPSYPSSPVLLKPNGTAFRQVVAGDDDVQAAQRPVIAIENRSDLTSTQGISIRDWKKAVVALNFLVPISFLNTLPLES